MRIPFEQLRTEFERVLRSLGFETRKAALCAQIFAENSRDGVYTHGLNRFPVFVQHIKDGLVKKDAEPVLDQSMGAIERWDGNYGPGMLNARTCMDRAIALASEFGIGCVAIRNTNHWMRGGTYGWQAAETGYIGICFTNTIANLPPWGGIDPRLGNNPLVIAVPRKGGHILLDMAISQYSFGKMYSYQAEGKPLPLPGGYNEAGELSTDPTAIIKAKRPLPIGFWKGSGLSLVLDLMVTVLSKGRSTAQVSNGGKEAGVSQVFICIKPDGDEQTDALIAEIVAYTKGSRPVEAGREVTLPGENMLKTRAENLEKGVVVDEKIWAAVQAL